MSSNCPLPVIGYLRTERSDPRATPVQSSLNFGEFGTLELEDGLVAGLDGLTGFDYAWLLTWLGDSASAEEEPPSLTQVPFLLQRTGRSMGIFATRGPRRINPIGLSLVRLISVDGPAIRFAGVDMVDGTPVIDLKPYVTAFDRPPGEVRSGWFDEIELPLGRPPTARLAAHVSRRA